VSILDLVSHTVLIASLPAIAALDRRLAVERRHALAVEPTRALAPEILRAATAEAASAEEGGEASAEADILESVMAYSRSVGADGLSRAILRPLTPGLQRYTLGGAGVGPASEGGAQEPLPWACVDVRTNRIRSPAAAAPAP
jgi:hypothetical protein